MSKRTWTVRKRTYGLDDGLAVGIHFGAGLRQVSRIAVIAIRTDGVLKELRDLIIIIDDVLG